MAARNKLHRGITLVRKDADFPLVSHCMNRDKLMNMRKSITPNGEMLIDTKCYCAVSWNYKGRNEYCRPILKGKGMLAQYVVKNHHFADLIMEIRSPNPRNPAIKNPIIPRRGTPNRLGDILVWIISEEPTISAAIIILKDNLLLIISISSTKPSN